MGKAGKRKEMVEEWCGTGVGVKVLCVQVLHGKVCVQELCVKELCGREVCVKVWCRKVLCAKVSYVQVLWISGGWSCYVATTDVPRPWVEVNGNRRSWQHVQCQAARADRHESGRSAAGLWRIQKVCMCVCMCLSVCLPACLPNCLPAWQRRQTGTKRATRANQGHKCHACHAECTSLSPSATPAMQSAFRCRQGPRLPHKQPRRQRCQTGTKPATRANYVWVSCVCVRVVWE